MVPAGLHMGLAVDGAHHKEYSGKGDTHVELAAASGHSRSPCTFHPLVQFVAVPVAAAHTDD